MPMISKTLRFPRAILLIVSIMPVGWASGQSNASKQNATTVDHQPATPGGLTTKVHDDTFIIGIDDIVAVNVWKEPDISRSVPVRSDGMISLPLAGELQASGQTPHQLEMAIAGKLKNFISEPEVTVMIQEIRSQKFNILGQVQKPGSYPLTNSTTVLDAIAIAGGFRDFAKQKNIYVLRQNPNGAQSRLPFNYKEVLKGKNAAQNIRLQPRDTIVIP